MNKQDKMFFQALSQDRTESADMLEKPSMRGTKNSVVEKYSDQAHFIYELLQNADDAKATKVRFILEPSRLIFVHNGTRHFSVSNPADEDRDSQEGRLGYINSITAIANSNKIIPLSDPPYLSKNLPSVANIHNLPLFLVAIYDIINIIGILYATYEAGN